MTLRKDVKEVRFSEKTVSVLSLFPFFYFSISFKYFSKLLSYKNYLL